MRVEPGGPRAPAPAPHDPGPGLQPAGGCRFLGPGRRLRPALGPRPRHRLPAMRQGCVARSRGGGGWRAMGLWLGRAWRTQALHVLSMAHLGVVSGPWGTVADACACLLLSGVHISTCRNNGLSSIMSVNILSPALRHTKPQYQVQCTQGVGSCRQAAFRTACRLRTPPCCLWSSRSLMRQGR